MKDTACDFCQEIAGSGKSTFQRLYGEYLPNRILFENQHFVCIPTIGQIVDGSLLILPKHHLYTLASMRPDQVSAFNDILEQAKRLFKLSISFEHGCYPKHGHNCGVYHAHAHIVPVPEHIGVNELLIAPIAARNVESSLEILRKETEYAWFMNSNGETFYVLPNETNTDVFKSQYFRRWLVSRFRQNKEFDWKDFTHRREVILIDVVNKFRTRNLTVEA